jgi:hypothetical protein
MIMKCLKTLFTAASVVVLCCVALGWTERAFSFAEEPIGFKDPRSKREWTNHKISTIHSDLVYAMAVAAGFSDRNSATIEIWDQLVDSEKLGPGKGTVYSNCLGSTPHAPDPKGFCPPGTYDKQIWPNKDFTDTSCATARIGPYGTNFHWLYRDDSRSPLSDDDRNHIQNVKKWAWGETDTLWGWAIFAWGGWDEGLLTAKCRYSHWEEINTGIKAGTLEAFATYIHTLADTYSHEDCLNTNGAYETYYPWLTHTIINNSSCSEDGNGVCLPKCYYNPDIPHNGDQHGVEFGPTETEESQRTLDGAYAVYQELVERSSKREGQYKPLDLDATILSSMQGQPTLRQAIYNFVTSWKYQNQHIDAELGEYAQNRRDYAEQIAAAVKAIRINRK